MKSVFSRLLAALGLVTVGRHATVARRVHELTKEARIWKKRATRAAARTRDLEQQLQQRLQQQHASLKETNAELHRQHAEFANMQTQLTETERALALAREHLMAIEVKLDILEGAANVLDARTRTSTKRQPDTTGAAV